MFNIPSTRKCEFVLRCKACRENGKSTPLACKEAGVAVVNSPNYRARPTATFNQLAERWKTLVMVNHEDSTQRSEKSDTSKHGHRRLERFKSGTLGANSFKKS